MCGIAGILALEGGGSPTQPLLERMVKTIRHRGPDGLGYYLSEMIGLAHARLSIIDLTSGAQPIHNEDKSIWVSFNGEIFNYIELRSDLEELGHRFYTQSDTEVIVHAYEEFGEEFPVHLNGQFAIALWDGRAGKLLLVRDRAGILPLFYSRQRDRVIFASEVKAMLPAFGEAPRLNPVALDQIMTFWGPVDDTCIFDSVRQVVPGEMVIVESGQLRRKAYWTWTYPEAGQYSELSESQAAEELHALLNDATRIRLRSDVPVGAYLSGGLDSSVLTALMHDQGARLRTFSIGFEDTGFDESYYQDLMIGHIDADHTRFHCPTEYIATGFDKAILHTESPILRTAPVPMMLLSEKVRLSKYKVVLTGEGADEVFGGYDIFKEAKIRTFWARNPESKFRQILLKRLYPYLDISSNTAQAYLEAFFGIGLENPASSYFSHMPRWQTTAHCKLFFSDEFKSQICVDAVEQLCETFPDGLGGWDPFNRGQYIEAKTLMPGYLLSSQGDRMLMANSVEGRFPFLDHRVIEMASALDPKLKMKVLKEKYLLKESMQHIIPAEILNRHKQPYRAPDIPAFVEDQRNEYVQELLSESAITESGYFDPKRVGRLVKKAESGRAKGIKDNMAFIGILSTQIWHKHFVEEYHGNFGSE